MTLSIPSPEQAVWYLGPVPLRAYALCLLAGIVVAAWWTRRRLGQRGYDPDLALDVSMWAVPFGIVGARIYHVISSPQAYFGPGGDPARALRIWEGGLGVWGAVAFGALGAWIGCRRAGIPILVFGDCLAPALPLAQAVGRLGNWFNNEVYGAPTTLPWGLQIHQWDLAAGRAVRGPDGQPVVLGTFHPTFLYEFLWCLLMVVAILLLERRIGPVAGRLFAAYVMLYTLGRGAIENLRVDEANHVLGLRLNVWTSLVVFAFGAWWWWHLGRRPSQTPPVDGPDAVEEPDAVARSAADPSTDRRGWQPRT